MKAQMLFTLMLLGCTFFSVERAQEKTNPEFEAERQRR